MNNILKNEWQTLDEWDLLIVGDFKEIFLLLKLLPKACDDKIGKEWKKMWRFRDWGLEG